MEVVRAADSRRDNPGYPVGGECMNDFTIKLTREDVIEMKRAVVDRDGELAISIVQTLISKAERESIGKLKNHLDK